jgi:hypothetical protein
MAIKIRAAAILFYAGLAASFATAVALAKTNSEADALHSAGHITIDKTMGNVTPILPDAPRTTYKWNLNEKASPLLQFTGERLAPGFPQLLTFPMDQFGFPIFTGLSLDNETDKFLLPATLNGLQALHFIEFAPTRSANNFVSTDGSNIQLVVNEGMKTFRTNDGNRYVFVRYPDGEFRCANIRLASGTTLNLLYSANGLALHGVVDSNGRSVTFNYNAEGIGSITETWMEGLHGFTRTWPIGDQQLESDANGMRYAHIVTRAGKFLPGNALIREYTTEMADSDKLLAQIFGGPNAVAGANGFEPRGLAASYPFYRGDIIGDDGKLRRGHLSYAMHLYGSPDGRGDSPIYIPAGFTSHSNEPSPTDAAVTFYYPKLGQLTDVTLAVFHVANFQLSYEGDRVRIGDIGGPGGSSPLYKHSHIEFYHGNTSLPPMAERAALRINPTTVFVK